MRKYILIGLSINLIVFLCLSFIFWDLSWLSDIPNWRQGDRVFFLTLFLAGNIFIQLAIDEK